MAKQFMVGEAAATGYGWRSGGNGLDAEAAGGLFRCVHVLQTCVPVSQACFAACASFSASASAVFAFLVPHGSPFVLLFLSLCPFDFLPVYSFAVLP